jgi:hypothetical protein
MRSMSSPLAFAQAPYMSIRQSIDADEEWESSPLPGPVEEGEGGVKEAHVWREALVKRLAHARPRQDTGGREAREAAVAAHRPGHS